MLKRDQNDTRIFDIYPDIEVQQVEFRNRYGIFIAADLYLPHDYQKKQSPAIVVSGPFGAVKEQSSGEYAQEFASWGYVAIAFDPSFTGESGGEQRNVASPEFFTEDFSAAVDYIGLRPYVDRNRIGAMAICGLSGMALTATASDHRIKAVATASLYDMSRSISKGYMDSYTPEEKDKILDYLAEQRWRDAEAGIEATGPHEVTFDENDNPLTDSHGLPEELPDNPNPILETFWKYYKTPRGYHPRSINSTGAWTATTPYAFFNYPLMTNIKDISPRPILIITGEKAHSRYWSEDTYKAAVEPKELIVVPGADHCDLYDKKAFIPFDRLHQFYDNAL